MSVEPAVPTDDRPAGCGVQGCLTAAVALFVILLVWLLFIMLIRFSQPPEPRFGDARPQAPTDARLLTERAGPHV